MCLYVEYLTLYFTWAIPRYFTLYRIDNNDGGITKTYSDSTKTGIFNESYNQIAILLKI